MASNDEIQFDSQVIRIYKSGRVERLFPDNFVPPSINPSPGSVSSKDTLIDPQTGISARLYLPPLDVVLKDTTTKIPIIVYYHGGAFCLSSAFGSLCHSYLSPLVSQFNAIIVSIEYRLAPEHPVPAAYEDSWQALKWVASHAKGGGPDAWLNEYADFGHLFLAGDSAGANIAHHMAMRADELGYGVHIEGLVLIHPYFLVGSEGKDIDMEKMWRMTCPSTMGLDDHLINPMVDGAPSLLVLASRRVLVCVAEKDPLRDGGKSYYKKLMESGWQGEAEIFETEGEGHVFHVFKPTCEKALIHTRKIIDFIDRI